MRWTRDPRRTDRLGSRPSLERLESRTVLSTSTALHPIPASPELSIVPIATQSPVPSSNPSQPYDSLIGASATRQLYGVDGTGLTAAVIDTGVGYRHDALGDGFGPGKKVVAGYDFGDGDADPDASTWNHGTAVAGLIAGNDPVHPGVAPGAGIVALRVFDSQNRGSYEKIADALRWVIANHETYHISVVNLSLADGGNYIYDQFGRDGGIGQEIAGLISKLKELRIPVVSAAGNSFRGEQGMGFTAILPETISVTASDGSDQLLSDAQRLGVLKGRERATDLVAPGSGLITTTDGEGFADVRGTSFATPVVSGAIILLQSIYQSRFGTLPTVDQVESWLEDGAKSILDPVTGITLSRLDVIQAASKIPQAPIATPPPTTPPATDAPANPTPPPADSAPPAEHGGSSDPGTPPEESSQAPPSEPPSSPSEPPSSPSEPAPSPDVDSPTPEEPINGGVSPVSEQPNDTTADPPTPEIISPPPTSDPDTPRSPVNDPVTPGNEGENATEAALADLYRDGTFVGKIVLGGDTDPSAGALAAFGIQGTVSTIRLWSPTKPATKPVSVTPVVAGTVEEKTLDRRTTRREALAERIAAGRGGVARRFASFVQRLGGW